MLGLNSSTIEWSKRENQKTLLNFKVSSNPKRQKAFHKCKTTKRRFSQTKLHFKICFSFLEAYCIQLKKTQGKNSKLFGVLWVFLVLGNIRIEITEKIWYLITVFFNECNTLYSLMYPCNFSIGFPQNKTFFRILQFKNLSIIATKSSALMANLAKM